MTGGQSINQKLYCLNASGMGKERAECSFSHPTQKWPYVKQV